MLARRFTIVCLLTMLFGMWFAIIAGESSARRSSGMGMSATCLFGSGDFCAAPQQRFR